MTLTIGYLNNIFWLTTYFSAIRDIQPTDDKWNDTLTANTGKATKDRNTKGYTFTAYVSNERPEESNTKGPVTSEIPQAKTFTNFAFLWNNSDAFSNGLTVNVTIVKATATGWKKQYGSETTPSNESHHAEYCNAHCLIWTDLTDDGSFGSYSQPSLEKY